MSLNSEYVLVPQQVFCILIGRVADCFEVSDLISKNAKSVLLRHSIERLTSLFESDFAPLPFIFFVEIHVLCCCEKNWPPLLQ